MPRSANRRSHQEVAAALLLSAEAGHWPLGAKLPSTRELARRFGASRPTVRRALEVLQRRGLVEPRARSGWYLLRLPEAAAPPPTSSDEAALGEDAQADDDIHGSTNWMRSIFDHARQLLDRENFGLLMLVQWHESQEEIDRFWRRMDEFGSHVAGVLIVQPFVMELLKDELDRRGVPWVVINRADTAFTHNFVSADNIGAARTVGRGFASLGLERVVYLGPRGERWSSSREKCEGLIGGYIETCGRAPHQFAHLHCPDSPDVFGYEAMQAYLAEHEPPQAVYAHGDYLAIGAMRALLERGLRVPDDVAVVGSTGLDVARYVEPSLTVTSQPLRAMGEAAGRMLLHMARTGERRVPGRVLPCRLVTRDSFRPPAHYSTASSSCPTDSGSTSTTVT